METALWRTLGEFHHLKGFSSPFPWETARRLTNLFDPPAVVEIGPDGALIGGEAPVRRPVQEALVHRTRRGDLVRSKSEVIIADLLYSKNIPYRYEQPLWDAAGNVRYPDFTIEDAETGLVIYWEHLGMLFDPDYRARWERKKAWYEAQGIRPWEGVIHGPRNPLHCGNVPADQPG
ncbi:MAG: hypothetical protein WHS86_12005 [Desulfosoma sp.]